ncbi:MAG: glycoside hydrolase family 113 [Phycisphaerae bacterium]
MPRYKVRFRQYGTVKGKLLAAGVFVALVAGAFGLSMLRGNGADVSGPSGPTATAPAADVGKFRGISLQLHSGHPDHPYETYIGEIASVGANTVCLVVPGYQENASSTSIFIDARKAPRDERLIELMHHARRLGLRVVLMPIVLLENPRSGEWRGELDPVSWTEWWQDYSAFMLHYADVARRGRADALIIGSELVSTERQEEQWRTLIANIRGRYDGLLSYSANWDHYRPIEWWDALDIIGITTYFDLTGGDDPTLQRLMQSWSEIKEELLQWRRTQGKPLLFTEVGWPNQATAAQYPWDYFRAEDDPAPQVQATCFEAFFRTWFDEPNVAGFLVWEWRNYPQQPVGPEDPSYVPVGKPALDVIEKYYRRPVTGEGPATQPTGQSDAPPAPTDSEDAPVPIHLPPIDEDSVPLP